MKTVQVVLDEKLLRATDQAARRLRRNRSAFVREALEVMLRKLAAEADERRDREGYRRIPADIEEVRRWEAEAAWPPE
jgi:metal-responsive CopG/Arc/MetJ family transcriptional regulator